MDKLNRDLPATCYFIREEVSLVHIRNCFSCVEMVQVNKQVNDKYHMTIIS